MLKLETERWFSVEEIAAYFGISKEMTSRHVEREKMPIPPIGERLNPLAILFVELALTVMPI